MSIQERDNGAARSDIECSIPDCEDDASVVVYWSDDFVFPYCPECGDEQVEEGGREYPLREFYNFGEPYVSEMVLAEYAIQLVDFHADTDGMWIEAANPADAPAGYVCLGDTR